MAINKVVYGNNTLVDLTNDSVSANNLLEGETAHDRSGNLVTGTAKQGHIVQNSSGTDMTQRAKMQFADSHVSDDSTNGRTVVENIKEVDPADYASTTDEGIIVTDDGDDALIGPVSDDYIEVTADGTKSYSQILDGMYGDADIDKLNNYSILRIGNDIYSVDGEWRFGRGRNNSSNFNCTSIEFRASGSKVYSSNGSTTPTDISSTLVTNGVKFTLYYGNKKATVDLQTTANRCWYDDNTTVKQKIDGLNDRINTIKIYSQFRNPSSTGSITVGISYWSRYGILLFGNGNGSSLVGVIQIEEASGGYVRSEVKATLDGTVHTLNVTKNSDNTITISNLPSWGWYGLVSPHSIS